MVVCPDCVQDLPFHGASYPVFLLRVRHRRLLVLSSLLWAVTGVQGRPGALTFDTVSFPNLTPCNPVTFSWSGGVPPFAVGVFNDDNGDTVAEFDVIEDNFVTWTPPPRAVGKFLYAIVVDSGNGSDDTNDFVVRSANCATVVSSSTSTTATIPVQSVTASGSSGAADSPSFPTARSTKPSPNLPPSTPPTASALPSASRSPSSPPSQSLQITSSTSQHSNSNSNSRKSATATISSTDGSTSSSPSSTTSAGGFTSRPHRKSSVPAGEIAGIVLGAVAILCVLVALLVWRWAARRRDTSAHDKPRSPEDDNYTALQSSLSTQREPSLSTKAAIRRHAYAAAASPTTTTAPIAIGGISSSLLQPGDERDRDRDRDSGVVLHVHDRNSLGVEPPTPLPQRPAPRPISVLPPLRARGDEMRARGDRKTADVAIATGSPPEVAATTTTTTGTEARAGLQAQDHLGIEAPRDIDLDVTPGEGEGEGQGVLGRRARLTLIESDGGVRLAGGPPGLGLTNNSGCVVTTLPPPYHQYDS